MGYDNTKYVVPSFNNLLDKKDNSVVMQGSGNNSVSSPNVKTTPTSAPVKNKINSSVPSASAKKHCLPIPNLIITLIISKKILK